jgi:hypothetical protein
MTDGTATYAPDGSILTIMIDGEPYTLGELRAALAWVDEWRDRAEAIADELAARRQASEEKT